MGADVVYDSVGADTTEKSLNCLKRRGMYVTYGNSTGAVAPVSPLTLNKLGSLFMTRPTLFDYISKPEEKQMRLNDLYNWYNNGLLKIKIDQTFHLSKVKNCH